MPRTMGRMGSDIEQRDMVRKIRTKGSRKAE
jgi:hypothetical protein